MDTDNIYNYAKPDIGYIRHHTLHLLTRFSRQILTILLLSGLMAGKALALECTANGLGTLPIMSGGIKASTQDAIGTVYVDKVITVNWNAKCSGNGTANVVASRGDGLVNGLTLSNSTAEIELGAYAASGANTVVPSGIVLKLEAYPEFNQGNYCTYQLVNSSCKAATYRLGTVTSSSTSISPRIKVTLYKKYNRTNVLLTALGVRVTNQSSVLTPGGALIYYYMINPDTGEMVGSIGTRIIFFTGAYIPVVSSACKISTPTVNVPLGTYTTNKFVGVGTTVGEKNFDFTLNCDEGAKVVMSLQGEPGDSSNALSLTNAGSNGVASGVNVQILYNNSVLIPNSQSSTSIITGATSGNNKVTLSARYVQTKATVTEGTANATATLSIDYN